MLLTILLVVLSTIFIWDYTSKKRRYNLTSNVPGPKIYPLIGNTFIFKQKTTEDCVNLMLGYLKNYGLTVRLWVLNQLVFVIADPKILEDILTSQKTIKKNSTYDFLKNWLGTGLLISSGKIWFSHRKIITPTFNFKILEEFAEIFDEQSAIFVDKLKVHLAGDPFDIHPYITLAALDIISETAMGTKLNSQTSPNSEYVHAVCDMTDIIMMRFVKVYLKSDFIFKTLEADAYRKQERALKILHSFTEKVIAERRRSLLEKNNENADEAAQDEIGTRKKMALLDVLLQSTIDGKPLTNNEIRDEVDTFMFAGHDTTTSGLGFTLYLISRHPEVQDKLFAEIRSVIGDDITKPAGMRELNELKYLELVLKEALRLYPSVPIIGRHIEEDFTIDNTTIPAGTDIQIPIFYMHMDPKVFPNPEKFDPERHSAENLSKKENPYNYVPFSAGPRNCIGQKFAMLELKSTISKILRHYELLAIGEDPEPVLNVVLRSANGINLGIKTRVYT